MSVWKSSSKHKQSLFSLLATRISRVFVRRSKAIESVALEQREALMQALPEGTSKDWMKALDHLQPKIRHMRNQIDDMCNSIPSFDLLAAGTFLLQLDLILIKVRQNVNNYERRIKDMGHEVPESKALCDMAEKVKAQCVQCYRHVAVLGAMMDKRTHEQLNCPEIIEQVKALESHSKKLTLMISDWNEMVLKKDPLYHKLFEAELFRTLLEMENHPEARFSQQENYATPTTTGPLRDKAQMIVEPDLRKLGFQLITGYESLKRCAILYQGERLNPTLEKHKAIIEEYFLVATRVDKTEKDLIEALASLFVVLDSMRFVHHKGFTDKLKHVKRMLKQELTQMEWGKACLSKTQMSSKDKLSLKERFR